MITSTLTFRRSARHALLAALALAVAPQVADANTARLTDRTALKASAKVTAPRVASRPPAAITGLSARAGVPAIVSGTAAEQAGYVHYFTITGPDGQPINHVGIELPGDRIAHSFPDDGVSVMPFIKRGSMTTSAGNVYEVEHVYGVKPFDDASMRALQRELDSRVQPWLDAKTPFCDELTPSQEQCVSCLSFAMSVLYPERMPPDFKGAQKGVYTTEDLLMYLVGVPVDAPKEVRSRRIAALKVPESLREELARISSEADATQTAATHATVPGARARPATANLPKRVLTRRRS